MGVGWRVSRPVCGPGEYDGRSRREARPRGTAFHAETADPARGERKLPKRPAEFRGKDRNTGCPR